MNEKEFERLIQAERRRPLPACPPNMEASVLRRIRQASGEADWSSGIQWLFGLSRSGLALGSLALTVLLSTITSLVVISVEAPVQNPSDLAREALDFQVFNEVQVLNLDH
jgi:hypothetical protein